MGRPTWTKKERHKLSNSLKAYFRDPKNRKAQSERLKKAGIKPPSRKGISWTKEQREAISRRMKGRRPYKMTDQIRANMSKASKGRVISAETRRKMSEAHRGEKGSGWKGGVTSENKVIRRSLEYRSWRGSVFKRDEWTCRNCGARSKKGKRIELHVHHIKSFATFPESRFKISNGVTLCIPCHEKTDSYKKKTKHPMPKNVPQKKCAKCKRALPLTMYSDHRETTCVPCKREAKKSR